MGLIEIMPSSWWDAIPTSLSELRQFRLVPLLGLLIIVAMAGYVVIQVMTTPKEHAATTSAPPSQTVVPSIPKAEMSQSTTPVEQSGFNASNLTADDASHIVVDDQHNKADQTRFNADHIQAQKKSTIEIKRQVQ